ncbi:MAG: hypothetical protein ACJAVI_002850 [Candidatus Azotimanducaceae bacterium]
MNKAGSKLNTPVIVDKGHNPKRIETVVNRSACVAAIIAQRQIHLVVARVNNVQTGHSSMMPTFLPKSILASA